MKKVIFSFVLGVGFGAFGFAANQSILPQISAVQKPQEEQKPKTQKYDFSLFKFVKPVSKPQNDSLELKPLEKKQDKVGKTETAYYENPRDFFKFS